MRKTAVSSAKLPMYSTKLMHEAALAEMRQRIIQEYRIDPRAILHEMARNPRVTWSKVRENAHKKLREAVSETAFAQLLRYGVSTQLLNVYELTDVSYRSWAMVVPSKGFENYYAPVFRAGLPERVERGERYPQVQLAGIQQTIRNYKFGAILAIEEELFEDDQTGQIPQRAGEIGENMAYIEEQFFYAQVFQADFSAVGMELAGGGALLEDNLEAAHKAARKVRDGLGNIIVVRPDTLITDTDDELNAERLLQTMAAVSNPGATPTDGQLRYFGTINPFRDKYTPLSSPFLSQIMQDLGATSGNGLNGTSRPWLLVQKKKGAIFQDRTAVTVTQEAPNSGEGFDSDTMRFKAKRRFGAGVVDPRFIFRGN